MRISDWSSDVCSSDLALPAATAPVATAPAATDPEVPAVDLERAALQAAEASLSPEQRREIQRDLRALGHYGGAIDGSFGPGTRTAIESYQKVAGLDATGYQIGRAHVRTPITNAHLVLRFPL